jgi:hypothetical protein
MMPPPVASVWSVRVMTPWSNQTSMPLWRRMAVVAKVRPAVRWCPWCSVAPLRCSGTACAAMMPWPQFVSSPALVKNRTAGVSAVLVSMNAVWEVPVLRAMACRSSSVSVASSIMTAVGLPPSPSRVQAFTTATGGPAIRRP